MRIQFSEPGHHAMVALIQATVPAAYSGAASQLSFKMRPCRSPDSGDSPVYALPWRKVGLALPKSPDFSYPAAAEYCFDREDHDLMAGGFTSKGLSSRRSKL